MTTKVKECMTRNPTVISKTTSIEEVARKMQELDTGFLPVGDGDRLDGVVTDRDIVLRVLAQGKDPHTTTAGEAITDKVLYCFEEDNIREAARSMKEQQVYRLVVLSDRETKRLRGIVTLGDISRNCQETKLVGETTEAVCLQQGNNKKKAA